MLSYSSALPNVPMLPAPRLHWLPQHVETAYGSSLRVAVGGCDMGGEERRVKEGEKDEVGQGTNITLSLSYKHRTHNHTHMHMHTFAHTYNHAHTHKFTHTHRHVHTNLHTHPHTHTHIHTHTHFLTLTPSHTHTHTHTRTPAQINELSNRVQCVSLLAISYMSQFLPVENRVIQLTL